MSVIVRGPVAKGKGQAGGAGNGAAWGRGAAGGGEEGAGSGGGGGSGVMLICKGADNVVLERLARECRHRAAARSFRGPCAPRALARRRLHPALPAHTPCAPRLPAPLPPPAQPPSRCSARPRTTWRR
jgi:magnesium-transporting ATPase (P-type)